MDWSVDVGQMLEGLLIRLPEMAICFALATYRNNWSRNGQYDFFNLAVYLSQQQMVT